MVGLSFWNHAVGPAVRDGYQSGEGVNDASQRIGAGFFVEAVSHAISLSTEAEEMRTVP